MNADVKANVLLIIKKLKARLDDVMNLLFLELIRKPMVIPNISKTSTRKLNPFNSLPISEYWNTTMGRIKVKTAKSQRSHPLRSRQLVRLCAICKDRSHFQAVNINPRKMIADVTTDPINAKPLLKENPHI